MVSDLGGFVAATWMRGLRLIHLPTTMEAAIDASLGGKTGVNLPAGKNLVGAFHQPIAVFIDTDFLGTLPERDFRAGLAESVKHAAIRDPDFLAWQLANAETILARGPELTELIQRNCRIKLEIVRQDPTEQGVRVILNYGHTLGHAIEHVLGYELRHGECVALGMRVENEIASRRGLLSHEGADAIHALLTRYGLPSRLPRRLDPERIIEASRLDKKNRGAGIACVLVSRPGSPQLVPDVAPQEISAALDAIQPAAVVTPPSVP
jgi:3-dehydroquinate synthase